MVITTTVASLKCNIMEIPTNVLNHPWFTATLMDAYCGFITFYAWVAYKERSMLKRIIWFVAIMIGGNLTMSAYMLIHLFKLPTNATAAQLLLAER